MKALVFNFGQKIPNTRLSYLCEAARTDPKRRRAKFLCECGNVIFADLNWVRFLNITSCGCLKSEQVTAKNTKHGQATRGKRSGSYRSWAAMHQRVLVNPLYKHRVICSRWSGEQGFENFYADMGDRPKGLTIERIDNNGIYEPLNCKWASMKDQNNNKSNSRGSKL